MTPQTAKLVRILSLIALAFIVGCIASRPTIKQSLTVGPVVKESLIAQIPTVAKSARVAVVAKPPMTHAAISWIQTNTPPDTVGPCLFIVYSCTNLTLQYFGTNDFVSYTPWRYYTDTYSASLVVSITNRQQEWFKVESYRLAVGMRWPK